MRDYELLCIYEPRLAEDALTALKGRVQKYFDANECEIESEDEWGLRKLAYPIGKHEEGVYCLYNFKCKPDNVSTLRNQIKLTQGVVRFVIVRREDDARC